MASRCINALNELDQISEKVFYKHSKSRLKAEVEAKLRASKSRTDRLSLDGDDTFSSVGSRNSYHSSLKGRSVISTPNKRKTQSAAGVTRAQQNEKEQERARTTKSCPDYINSRKKSSRVTTSKSAKTTAGSDNDGAKSPSMFGQHTRGQGKYEAKPWFNLNERVNMGAIDSFACDENNERALCYAVDQKHGTPVPKLLRHRLQVRIGQNGIIRGEPGDDGEMENASEEREMKESEEKAVDSEEKTRPAPLSWEEQLNWRNANVVSPKPPAPEISDDKGLCETTPVIFNPRVTKPTKENNEKENTSSAYRVGLETRRVMCDRGNLTCTEKYITSVELEDAREVTAAKSRKDKLVCKSRESLDSDKMDMTTTIKNIEQLYPRGLGSSEGDRSFLAKREATQSKLVEMDGDKVENQTQGREQNAEPQSRTNSDLEKESKVSKKVSFVDQMKNTKQVKQNESITVLEPKGKLEEEVREDKERNLIDLESSKCDHALSVREIMEGKRSTHQRPRSSHERLTTQRESEIEEYITKQQNRHARPFTAPPSSPRNPVDKNSFVNFFESDHLRVPIHVPTSEREIPSASASEGENITPSPSRYTSGVKPSNETEEDKQSDSTDAEPMKPRVAVTCKSAPLSRVASRAQDPALARSKSSMSTNRKQNYTPHKPVAVYAESSMELPKNLPPAQALIELRKKIREDLARETEDLQLDIQQLYLKHHHDYQ